MHHRVTAIEDNRDNQSSIHQSLQQRRQLQVTHVAILRLCLVLDLAIIGGHQRLVQAVIALHFGEKRDGLAAMAGVVDVDEVTRLRLL